MLLLPTQCLCTQNLTLSFVIIVILRPFVLRIDINHAPMIVLKITVTTVTVTLWRIRLSVIPWRIGGKPHVFA